jgi:uncharacterized membrane protein YcfT
MSAAADARPPQAGIAAERDATVDTARGLGLLLVLTVQFAFEGARHGAPGFAPVYAVLNLVALPVFMVAAGHFLEGTIGLDWRAYAARKLAPFVLAVCAWGLGETALAVVAATPAGRALHSLGGMTEAIPLLLITPGFLLLARLFRAHAALVMIVAVVAEILLMPGRTFGGECMRALLYFYLGLRFRGLFGRLASEARADPPMAVSAIAVWLAIAALCAFAPIPQAHGAPIATLPFATLGLGVAGAGVAFMGAALLAQGGVWTALATIGRNWIAVAAAAPLAVSALRLFLLRTHVAASEGHADLILGVAALAGFLTLAGITAVQNRPVEVKPDAALRTG